MAFDDAQRMPRINVAVHEDNTVHFQIPAAVKRVGFVDSVEDDRLAESK